MDIELLKDELIRDEGLRLDAYKDTLGNYTFGVGHLLGPEDTNKAKSISKTEALVLLDTDIHKALARIQSLPAFLACDTDSRQRALVNMAFQLGSRLLTFTKSLSLIEKQLWLDAGKELRNSVWYRQTPNRAERVIQMIEKG